MKREEIRKELEQLPKEWVVAFAARIAAQCLPALLTGKETRVFSYWPKEKRSQYLFAVLRANGIAYAATTVNATYATYANAANAAANATNATDATANATANAATAAANAAAYADADASYAASYATVDATAKSAAANAKTAAANAAAYAATNVANVGIDIEKKINLLREKYQRSIRSGAYLRQPLYSAEEHEWSQRGTEFVQALRDYGEGFDFWADWYQGWLKGRILDTEQLKAIVYLSEEQLAQKSAQANAYLKNFSKTEQPLNRIRVIFLGYGEAGKTSLIRALNNQEVVPGKEKMTPGIDIFNWKVPETEITAHFWDFGGQVMAHATHQFFLRSQCLYILLLDGRTEINANEQAEYWLEHVRAFGRKAPVMLVGNKADLCAVNLNMTRLKEKHSNVTEFYPLSCTQYQGDFFAHFQRFRNDLISRIKEIGMHQIRFLKFHFTVLEKLVNRSGQDSFLQKTAYERLCAESGVAEQGGLDQGWLLDLLDKLGVILHFPEIASLDGFILNPRWLTYGVYTLLYAQESETEKGRLKEGDIVRILGRKEVRDNLGNILSYPPDKADIIIKAMELFKICFRCRHASNLIIIPTLLESDQPRHGFNKADSLIFEFSFAGFLPRHVMPNFIVGRHDEIVKDLVWQNGVVLQQQDGDAEALAQVDYHDRVLSLWVRGPQASRYFYTLHDEISRILRRMPDLPFEERVIVPESSRIGELPVGARLSERPIRANFRQLLAMEAKGRTEYDCEYGTFDLQQILRIMPASDRESYRQAMFRPEITEFDVSRPVPSLEKVKIWQQWWVISCVIGLVAGVGAGWYFWNWYVGGGVFLAVSFAVSRLNRKRRFYSASWTVLSYLAGVNVLPYVESVVNLSKYFGEKFEVLFKLDAAQAPAVSVSFVILSAVLFILDYLENKDRVTR